MTLQHATAPPSLSSFDHQTILYAWTVDQYHQLIEQGTLAEGEPYELLDGQLVRKDRSAEGEDPMTVGLGHAWVVGELSSLSEKLRRLGCYLRVQLPLTLPPYNEPEPDGAIVLGSNNDYRARHPEAGDVLCVIEVADSSLRRDRTTKLRIYAGAEIPAYFIINLVDRCVEAYTEPLPGNGHSARYGRMETLKPGQKVELLTRGAKRLLVPVRSLLP